MESQNRDYSQVFGELSSVYGFGGGHFPNPHSVDSDSSESSRPSSSRSSHSFFRRFSRRPSRDTSSVPPPPPPTPWTSQVTVVTTETVSVSNNHSNSVPRQTQLPRDYEVSLGNLVSTYGLGGSVVTVPSTTTRVWSESNSQRRSWRDGWRRRRHSQPSPSDDYESDSESTSSESTQWDSSTTVLNSRSRRQDSNSFGDLLNRYGFGDSSPGSVGVGGRFR